MKMKLKIIFFFLFLTPTAFWGGDKEYKNNKRIKIEVNDDYNYLDINQILMWVSNIGLDSHNPMTEGPGFFWRKGENSNHTLVFEDGLMLGGIINEDVRISGSKYFRGLQAGKILDDGTADNSTNSKYRVFKLYSNWLNLPPGDLKSTYKKDFDEWPVEDGAPWIDKNQDGKFEKGIDEPEILGDEILWSVYNDLKTEMSPPYYKTKPLGLEIQCAVFGFNLSNVMGRTIIKKYKIINKGKNNIQDLYFGYWVDPDVGNLADDYVGCDSTINLGFSYNKNNLDEYYGTAPPSIGYVLLQGPIVKGFPDDSAKFNGKWIKNFVNLPMGSFIPIAPVSESSDSLETVLGFYYYLQGKSWLSSRFMDPILLNRTNFVFSGDPESQTGWLDNGIFYNGIFAGDAEFLISSGPVSMAPADTQEITLGIIVSFGNNNLNSVTELKNDAKLVQYFYNYYSQNYSTITSLPGYFYLSQNYPNPFNSSTKIKYSLPVNSNVNIKIYDILGGEISTLINEYKTAGDYEINFDASGLSSGVYFYKIEANGFVKCRKMSILK